MEPLNIRIKTAQKALKTLNAVVGLKPISRIKRDAAIQRFEYTFEATWKTVQKFLVEEEGLSPGSPKSCIRFSREVNLLNEEQTSLALEMSDSRNLTSHTYDEKIADQIYHDLKNYSILISFWLKAVELRLKNK